MKAPKILIASLILFYLVPSLFCEDRVLGHWSYKGPPKIAFSIIQDAEQYYLISDYGEDVIDKEKVVLTKTGDVTRISFDPPSKHGEFFVLNIDGDLEVRNSEQIIEVAKKKR